MLFLGYFNKKETFQRVFGLVAEKKNQNRTLPITLIL